MYKPEDHFKRKPFEPFKLYGIEADINSIEKAKEVIKANLYYLFFYASLLLGIGLVMYYYQYDKPEFTYGILTASIFYFFMSSLIKFFKSRAAAVLIILAFTAQAIDNITTNGLDGMKIILITFVFLACYRCVKATFAYHRLKGST